MIIFVLLTDIKTRRIKVMARLPYEYEGEIKLKPNMTMNFRYKTNNKLQILLTFPIEVVHSVCAMKLLAQDHRLRDI